MSRLAIGLVLLVALTLTGSVAAQGLSAGETGLVRKGYNLYSANCVMCHGEAGSGVSPPDVRRGAGGVTVGAGPPLRGVGALAADFYLRTGYMPLRSPFEQPRRRRPQFDDAQIRALTAYIASLGAGPSIPEPRPERGSLSAGLSLFTEHCAGCHQVVGEGGYVTGGVAPPLEAASAVEIAEAVRIGPYLMPTFSKRVISDRQLDSIIRYVQYAKNPTDRGGWSIGHLGPVPEGIVAWLVGAALLVVVCVVIGARRRT